jgi:hypothetical protein
MILLFDISVSRNMSSPVLVLLTSEECGMCVKMRRGLIKVPGGHDWGDALFKRIAALGWRVCILNFSTLGPTNVSSISNYTEYRPTGPTLIAEPSGSATALQSGGKRETVHTAWQTWILQHVPESIMKYIAYWPNFAFFSGSVWDSAVAHRTPLFGYMPSLKVKWDGEGWAADRQATFTGHEDPLATCQKLIKDGRSLIPVPAPAHAPAHAHGPDAPRTDIRVRADPCQALGYSIRSSR